MMQNQITIALDCLTELVETEVPATSFVAVTIVVNGEPGDTVIVPVIDSD